MFLMLKDVLSGAFFTFVIMAPYLLLGFVIAGILSLFISAQMVQRHLGHGRFSSILKATLLGIPLPLCSCGVIPVGAMLRSSGAGKGATTSFLIATPQISIPSLLATYSLLGPVFALFKPLVAFTAGIAGGMAAEAVSDEKSTAHNDETVSKADTATEAPLPFSSRILKALNFAFIVLPRDIGIPLLVGIALAGLIGSLLPPQIIPADGAYEWLTMILMMLAAIPVYVCSTSSVPVAAMLVMKGLSPGAALVFLMTGPATNAATIATIDKLLGRRVTAVYLAAVALTALLFGFIINRVIDPATLPIVHTHGHEMFNAQNIVMAILLLGILLNAIRTKFSRK